MNSPVIDTYREDFSKYIGSRSLGRIVNVFNFAARNVGRKVKYIHFSRKDKAAATRADIELLCLARVLSKVVHSHCNGLPLQADADARATKLLFMDVGLMNAVSGLGWTAIDGMNETRLVNEGGMAEQFIGQHLKGLFADSPNRELSYWLRDGRATNAEVDYVAAFLRHKVTCAFDTSSPARRHALIAMPSHAKAAPPTAPTRPNATPASAPEAFPARMP